MNPTNARYKVEILEPQPPRQPPPRLAFEPVARANALGANYVIESLSSATEPRQVPNDAPPASVRSADPAGLREPARPVARSRARRTSPAPDIEGDYAIEGSADAPGGNPFPTSPVDTVG